MHHPTDRRAHTTTFVTLVVEHWLEREIAQWVHPMKDRSDDLSHHERMLLLLYKLSGLFFKNKIWNVIINGQFDHHPGMVIYSVSVSVHVCVCMCVCMCVWVCMSVCICVYVCLWVCTCVYMCVCVCECVCVYVSVHICVYMCVCVCECLC